MVRFDIINSNDVKDFYSDFDEVYGLINNVGVVVFIFFEERIVDEFMLVVEVNLFGMFLMF